MNKLATLLGCAMVLTGSLVPLSAVRAASSSTTGDPNPPTVSVTVWDTTGDWKGTADVATSDGTTFNQVPVTLQISDQHELTTTNNMGTGTQTYVFVSGTITFDPTFGFGNGTPMRLAGSVDVKQGNTTLQRGKFTLSGDLFTGELHAMSMTTNGVTTITATGSIIFVGNGAKPNPPAVAKLGLTKQ